MVENMPSGTAIRPGDVLKIRNGKTVEVLNTDAEGRLILADALSLASEDEPDAIVDLATLTGACMVALGDKIAGLMGNDESWIDQVQAAADAAGEPVWPLPAARATTASCSSPRSPTSATSAPASYGGALTAGLFLAEFVDGVPWAHLDIAGPARAGSDDGYLVKGGTGFGVRTLVELVEGSRSRHARADPLMQVLSAWRRSAAERLRERSPFPEEAPRSACGWSSPASRRTCSSLSPGGSSGATASARWPCSGRRCSSPRRASSSRWSRRSRGGRGERRASGSGRCPSSGALPHGRPVRSRSRGRDPRRRPRVPAVVDSVFDGEKMLVVGAGDRARRLLRRAPEPRRPRRLGPLRRYGLLMGSEGVCASPSCIVLVVVGVETAGPYGLLLAFMPFAAVAVSLRGRRESSAGPAGAVEGDHCQHRLAGCRVGVRARAP